MLFKTLVLCPEYEDFDFFVLILIKLLKFPDGAKSVEHVCVHVCVYL